MKAKKGRFFKYSVFSLFIFLLGINLITACGNGNGNGPTAKDYSSDPIIYQTPDPIIYQTPDPIIYQTHGLNFSPYMDGQNPDWGSVVSEKQVKERMEIIEPYTKWIRTFGVSLGVEHAGPIARDLYLETAIGAWLDKDPVTNDREMDKLINLAKDAYVDIAIVGSETLLRGDLTPAQLISYIERFRNEVPWIPVTTGEVYTELLEHTEVIDACDLVMVNYYPYWEGKDIDEAIAYVHLQHQRVVAAAGNKEVIISETGWPSDGNTIGDAVASLDNACKYFLNFVSWARAENVKYFYFEAFDEAWKVANEGPQGAHWGIFDKEGSLKSCMQKVFSDDTMENNWSCGNIPGGAGIAEIEFTYVPPRGSYNNLEGQVWHIDPSDYGVAVYIRVGSGWWTKPYWNNPLTLVNCDGEWVCDITTGGIDSSANQIAAFLVPIWYSPPKASGSRSLSANLYQDALDYVIVNR